VEWRFRAKAEKASLKKNEETKQIKSGSKKEPETQPACGAAKSK
jgi:hypothetical protein